MFDLIKTQVIASIATAPQAIVEFVESSGGEITQTNGAIYTFKTKNNTYLRISYVRGQYSWEMELKVEFGSGVDADGHIILMDDINWAYYWSTDPRKDYYSKPFALECWRYDDGVKQVFLFHLVSQSDSDMHFYWLFGDYENDLINGHLDFVSLGNFSSAHTIMPSPSSSTSTSYRYNTRGRVHVTLESTPTQTQVQYTTRKTAASQGAIAMAMMAPIRNCDSTPSAGLPIQPWSLYIKDVSNDMYIAGIVPGLYFAPQSFPHGYIITKGNRHFRVFRSIGLNSVNYGSFLLEVNTE